MPSARVLPLLTLALLFGACAGRVSVPPWTALEPQIEAGLLDVDVTPGSVTDERTLLNTTLAHAHPRSSIFDPGVAHQYLRRLLELYPRSSNAALAGYLAPLLEELDSQQRSERQRESEYEEMAAQMGELTERIDRLESALESAGLETASYRQQVQRLESDLQAREQRIQELETTLRRLRSVDLRTQE